MKHVLFVLFALFAPPLLASPAFADPMLDGGVPADTANVYLGHVGEDGSLATHFDGMPTVHLVQNGVLEVAPAVITCLRGAKVHAAPTLASEVIGRLPFKASVKLLRIHVRYGYAWGEVTLDRAKLLTLRLPSYAVDGFTRCPGTSPGTARRTPLELPVALRAALLHRRLTC